MNKTQLSMGFVLGLVVTFFIIMAFVSIHYGITLSGTQADKLKKLESDAVQIATVVSALPELQCTRNNDVTVNCINKIDVQELNDLMMNVANFQKKYRLFYQSLFGFSKITLYEDYVNECNDGMDNDNGGDIDTSDADCAGVSMSESNECNDGMDNDGDGNTDGTDTDCAGVSMSEETTSIVIYNNPGDTDINRRHFTLTVKKMIYNPLGDGNCFALGK